MPRVPWVIVTTELTKSALIREEFEFTVQVGDTGSQSVVIGQKDLYVLENWHRIYDAMNAKPPDERETFKYQENSSSSTKNNTTNGDEPKTNGKLEY